jgi:hypothetical protein
MVLGENRSGGRGNNGDGNIRIRGGLFGDSRIGGARGKDNTCYATHIPDRDLYYKIGIGTFIRDLRNRALLA